MSSRQVGDILITWTNHNLRAHERLIVELLVGLPSHRSQGHATVVAVDNLEIDSTIVERAHEWILPDTIRYWTRVVL